MHIPSGMGRPGHLVASIKVPKSIIYSVGVLDKKMHARHTGVPRHLAYM